MKQNLVREREHVPGRYRVEALVNGKGIERFLDDAEQAIDAADNAFQCYGNAVVQKWDGQRKHWRVLADFSVTPS